MATKRLLYFFANWKMYLNYDESVALARTIVSDLVDIPSTLKTVLFPNALSLVDVEKAIRNSPVEVGTQNIYWIGKGGCTGEISASMYKEVGATYALIGHSERRHLFQETNHQVRQKLEAALEAELIPVLCIGETMHERENGQTEEALEAQLRSAFTDISWPKDLPLIVAYEPVWAISKGRGAEDTGKHCEPAEAERVAGLVQYFIQGLMPSVSEMVFLFGGSVRPATIAGYLAESHIDGVLVGAASTHFDSWKEIVHQAI